MESYLRPGRESAGVRRDLRKFLRAVNPRYTIEAAEKLKAFDKPVLLPWAAEDKLFPLDYPRRFAAALPNARVEVIPNSRTFVPEDQPEALADAIASFMREPAAVVAQPRGGQVASVETNIRRTAGHADVDNDRGHLSMTTGRRQGSSRRT